uniref:hypothetical protein n=1 Tax=Amycolatopsis sp. CA-293810 TaxID=3239926 RepID=UPI003F492F62
MTHADHPDPGTSGPQETGAVERRPVQHALADQLSALVGEMDVESDTTRRKLSKGGLSRAGQAQRMLQRAERVMEMSLACDRAQGMSWTAIATMTGRPAEDLRDRYGETVEAVLEKVRAEAPIEDTGPVWMPTVPRREYRGEFYSGPTRRSPGPPHGARQTPSWIRGHDTQPAHLPPRRRAGHAMDRGERVLEGVRRSPFRPPSGPDVLRRRELPPLRCTRRTGVAAEQLVARRRHLA